MKDGSSRLKRYHHSSLLPISLRNVKNFDVALTCTRVVNTKQCRRVSLKGTIMYLLDQIPLHMDYDGQRRAERLSRIIVTLFGAVGLVWGYIIQQFSQTVYILGAGFVLAALVTIPPWPMYRRKPLAWQKPRPEGEGGEQQSALKQKKKK